MAQIRTIDFQARWNTENVHLQTNLLAIWRRPDLETMSKIRLLFQKGIEGFVSVFLYPAQRLCQRLILPAASISFESRAFHERQWRQYWVEDVNPSTPVWHREMRRTYEPIEMNVTGPDGRVGQAVFYRNRRGTDHDLPTMICFQPNMALAKFSEWNYFLKKGINSPVPFNVILFDYRNENLQHVNQLIIDADALYQAAHERLGISERNLHFLGYSFGGAIGASLAALHPSAGKCVSIKSFESIASVITHSAVFDRVPLPECMRNVLKSLHRTKILKMLLKNILSVVGWNVDVSRALRKIGERVLVVYHPADELIPPQAGAMKHVDHSHTVQMAFKPTVSGSSDRFHHHNKDLKLYQDENGLNITKRILNFILGTHLTRHRDAAARHHYIIEGNTFRE